MSERYIGAGSIILSRHPSERSVPIHREAVEKVGDDEALQGRLTIVAWGRPMLLPSELSPPRRRVVAAVHHPRGSALGQRITGLRGAADGPRGEAGPGRQRGGVRSASAKSATSARPGLVSSPSSRSPV